MYRHSVCRSASYFDEMRHDDTGENAILRAFAGTLTTLDGVAEMGERLCEKLRQARQDGPELCSIEEQLRSVRSYVPELAAYVRALQSDIRIH
jgi:hypothetical protein